MPAPNLKLVAPNSERAQLVREHAALLDEMARLREAQARLHATQDDGAAIQAELEALVAAEATELREWAETGQGDPPAPHVEKRAKIGRRLAAANDRARALGVATADVDAKAGELAERITAKAIAIEALMLADLSSDAKELLALEAKQARELQETTTRLDALRFWFGVEGRSHFDRGDHDRGRLYVNAAAGLERKDPIGPATNADLLAATRLWGARATLLSTAPEAAE